MSKLPKWQRILIGLFLVVGPTLIVGYLAFGWQSLKSFLTISFGMVVGSVIIVSFIKGIDLLYDVFAKDPGD